MTEKHGGVSTHLKLTEVCKQCRLNQADPEVGPVDKWLLCVVGVRPG